MVYTYNHYKEVVLEKQMGTVFKGHFDPNEINKIDVMQGSWR